MSNATPPPPPPAGAYQPQQQVPLTPQDQRLWSTLIHLGGIIFSFLPALIGYLVLKDRGDFVRDHTRVALNFQISLAIYSVGVAIITTITFGIGAVLYLPLAVIAVVFMVIAGVKANKGEFYSYPLTINFIK
jgi:uncharacterized Tic20 family protein